MSFIPNVDILFLDTDIHAMERWIEIPVFSDPATIAATDSGLLTDFSTPEVHVHSCHQVLAISDGVSLLIDDKKKQPLYGSMCAFIPAGCPHRTVVVGRSVSYQSLFIRRDLLPHEYRGIVIFTISGLGGALFGRMAAEEDPDFSSGIARDCLDLFLKILSDDMKKNAFTLLMPRPVSEECVLLTEYIEKNYMHKITFNRFQSVLPYSTRHIARLFVKEMRITLFEYLRLYRVFMASVMLQDTGRSVLEISLACGYESLSSFYSDFGRYFSGTPGSLRRKTG